MSLKSNILQFAFNLPSISGLNKFKLSGSASLTTNGALIYRYDANCLHTASLKFTKCASRHNPFTHFQAAETSLGCLPAGLPTLEMMTTSPFIKRVFSSRNVTFRPAETIHIIVEFSDHVIVDGAAWLAIYPGQQRSAHCKQEEPSPLLVCWYTVQIDDFSSDLDYLDQFSLTTDHIAVALHHPTVSAVLRLPPHGSIGSLARESEVAISQNAIYIVETRLNKSANILSSGDSVCYTIEFSDEILLETRPTLRLHFQADRGNYTQLAQFVRFVPPNQLAFVHEVHLGDTSGNVSFEGYYPLAGVIVSATNRLATSLYISQTTAPSVVTINTTPPSVVRVAIEQPAADSFFIHDVITITVKFTKAVVLNDSLDSYCLWLKFDVPAESRCASYLTGSNTDTIAFQYHVVDGDAVEYLSYDGVHALQGTVWCRADRLVQLANTTLPEPGVTASASFGSRVSIQTAPVHVNSMFPLNYPGRYIAGEDVAVLVRFSRPVMVVGQPTLRLRLDNRIVHARYAADQSFTHLRIQVLPSDVIFLHTIQHVDESYDVVHDGPDAIEIPPGGGIFVLNAAGTATISANTTLREPGDFTLENGKVQRQWMSRFPSQLDVVLRDAYYPHMKHLTASLSHTKGQATLFSGCCNRQSLGREGTLGHRANNVGFDYTFGDTRSTNLAKSGIASQSSTSGDAIASRAVDGNSDGLLSHRSVAQTSGWNDENPWWQIRFAGDVAIRTIVVWPRRKESLIAEVQSITILTSTSYELPSGTIALQIAIGSRVIDTLIDITLQERSIESILKSTSGIDNMLVEKRSVLASDKHGYKILITFYSLGDIPQLKLINESLTDDALVVIQTDQEGRVAADRTGSPEDRWITPAFVYVFNTSVQDIPTSADACQKLASFVHVIKAIDHTQSSINIVLPELVHGQVVRIQRQSTAALSIAEVQVYSEPLHYTRNMQHLTSLPSQPLTKPYQPEAALMESFSQVPFDGDWLLTISTTDLYHGQMSDWMLVVTDLAGVVQPFYMDIQATIHTLPKYGSLFQTHTPPLGHFQQIFSNDNPSELHASPDMKRPQGDCFIGDNSGSDICPENYGVAPRLTSRRLGDILDRNPLRNERIVRYQPHEGYLGPDSFTYRVQLGSLPLLDGGLVETRIHIRNCRSQEYNLAFGINITRHALCDCRATEDWPYGNLSSCSTAIALTCADADQRNLFHSMCTTCPAQELSFGQCLAEVDRAVQLVQSRFLCDDAPGLPACESESFTKPGPEPFLYFFQPHHLSSGRDHFTPLGNSYGGQGSLDTTTLA